MKKKNFIDAIGWTVLAAVLLFSAGAIVNQLAPGATAQGTSTLVDWLKFYDRQTPKTTATGAATTSDTMKHYSQGTWVPKLTGLGNPTTATGTYSVQKGFFIRSGHLVHADFNLTTSAFDTTPTTSLIVQNLPFTSYSTSGYAGGCNVTNRQNYTLAAASDTLHLVLGAGTSTVELYTVGGSGNRSRAPVDAAITLAGSCEYIAD